MNIFTMRDLSGKCTARICPLLQDDKWWFLAVDFDQESWQLDAVSFLELCLERRFPAVLERSRSGNGAHAWMFFSAPIQATRTGLMIFPGRAIASKLLSDSVFIEVLLDLFPVAGLGQRKLE